MLYRLQKVLQRKAAEDEWVYSAADSSAPSRLASVHLVRLLPRSTCCLACEAPWCNIEHVVKDPRATHQSWPQTRMHTHTRYTYQRYSNDFRAAWASSAERTKKRRSKIQKIPFPSCFHFPVGCERREYIQRINREVCLCQCRGRTSRVNAIIHMLLFIVPLQNDEDLGKTNGYSQNSRKWHTVASVTNVEGSPHLLNGWNSQFDADS